jgi:hypothetical protein
VRYRGKDLVALGDGSFRCLSRRALGCKELQTLVFSQLYSTSDGQTVLQILQVERLGQEVVGTRRHGSASVIPVTVGSHEDERCVRSSIATANPLAQFGTIHAGHPPVADDNVGLVFAEDRPPLNAVLRLHAVVSEFSHSRTKHQSVDWLVLDDEDLNALRIGL